MIKVSSTIRMNAALPKKVETEMGKRLLKAAEAVAQEAFLTISGPSKSITGEAPPAPPGVVTGTLRRGLDTRLVGDTAIVATTSGYGAFQEFGTRFMGARPFLRPALDKAKKSFPSLFKDLI